MKYKKCQNPYLSRILTLIETVWFHSMETAGVEPASQSADALIDAVALDFDYKVK